MAIPRNLANFAPKLDSSGNPTFTAPTVFSAGTASDPSITFTGDTNTGLFAPAADTIAFSEGGAEAMRIDSGGRALIGATSTFLNSDGKLYLAGDSNSNNGGLYVSRFQNTSGGSPTINILKSRGSSIGSMTTVQNADELGGLVWRASDGTSFIASAVLDVEVDGTVASNQIPSRMRFLTANSAGSVTERARITSGGDFFVGMTASSDSTAGVRVFGAGMITATRSAEATGVFNRLTNDGTIISIRQDTTEEGTISVSGTTVSYNGGNLSRWAQLTTPKDDTPLFKGTVMSNLDEMNVYIAPTTYWTEEDELPVDEEGNPTVAVGDVKEETSVSDNEQLNKVKVSDVEGDPNVAGVFVNWTYDEAHQVDEINMAMTGDMIIRIAEGVTVARGDLLMSAGDGTAKPQGDDIVRSKTIAKVTSTHVTCTYEDGSYCVPCVLMAC
jgi:hypothetical protein